MTTRVAGLQTSNQTTDQNKTLPELNSDRNERTIKIWAQLRTFQRQLADVLDLPEVPEVIT